MLLENFFYHILAVLELRAHVFDEFFCHKFFGLIHRVTRVGLAIHDDLRYSAVVMRAFVSIYELYPHHPGYNFLGQNKGLLSLELVRFMLPTINSVQIIAIKRKFNEESFNPCAEGFKKMQLNLLDQSIFCQTNRDGFLRNVRRTAFKTGVQVFAIRQTIRS